MIIALCQRPKRAFFISTPYMEFLMGNESECVNALNGLSSFLLFSLAELMQSLLVCQRPKRAFFISTLKKTDEMEKRIKGCQRPKRAFFISTDETSYGAILRPYCVNALNGLSSFLPDIRFKDRTRIVTCVSTP